MPSFNANRFEPTPGIGLIDPRFYSVATIQEGTSENYVLITSTEPTFTQYTRADRLRIGSYTSGDNLSISAYSKGINLEVT